MSETLKICRHCGMALPPDAPAGLCPACLLRGAHTETTGEGLPARGDGQPRDTPRPGRDFGGYRVNRQLGEGGMGKVFEAVQLATGRRVALKVMGQALTHEKDRQRFLREGRMAAAVNHPNVVYVYGSEEIAGVPVIVMELVRGGTLNDRLKSAGPLPATAAAALALEIMAGLEAAHAAGVLHRDIKPANCFMTTDSQVKVGDFGLSISTEAHAETRLTAQGTAMGTPAYASPEQLQGEELDVTADIYSTGATLYHLLTGQPPFTTKDFVKQIAEVLGKEPEAPHRLRPEVPVELSRIVLRCLAKDRKQRFQTYAELRDALLPFSAGEPVPAPLPRRLLAGLLDQTVTLFPIASGWLAGISFLPEHFWARHPTLASVATASIPAWYWFYYTLCEGRWGAGLGKTLCGLRVTGPDRRPPGLLRAFVRTAAFTGLLALLILPGPKPLVPLAPIVFLLLFVTLRKRNGYAGLHDWLSRTRVVVRPRQQSRPRYAAATPAVNQPLNPPAFDQPASLGPYVIKGRLWERENEALLLGFDPVLSRPLWVHLQPAETAPVAELRQDLSRPSRLRWLNCGVTGDRRWDAYEAVEGTPLLHCQQPAPWSAVRFWLLDMAEEVLGARRQPLTAPVFSFDRIWLACSGRAVVLDFPCPQLAEMIPPPADFEVTTTEEAQWFLDAVARRTLEGPQTTARPLPVNARLPLPAAGFLDRLAQGSFDRLELVAGNLRHFATLPAEISRSWRIASLALLPITITALALFLSIALYFGIVKPQLAAEQSSPTRATHSIASGRHVPGTGTGTNHPTTHTGKSGPVHWEAEDQELRSPAFIYYCFIAFSILGIILAVGTDLSAAFFLGFNPLLKLFGMAVVSRQGRRASRWRLVLRSVVAVVPLLIALTIFYRLCELASNESAAGLPTPPHYVWVTHWVLTASGAGLLLLILVTAVLTPHRSLADRIAGTWLVPE